MKLIKKFLVLFCMTLILSGCVGWLNTAPENNVDFANVERLSGLDGTYQNQSEGASEQPTYYLSSLIWPEEKIDPKTIETIEVKAITDNTIQVKGLGINEVKKESVLVEGKDFDLDSGRIVLRRRAGIAGFGALMEEGDSGGQPLVGPFAESVELGLDQKGHGKLKNSVFFAGLFYLIYPTVLGGSDEVRFKRIK